MHSEPTHSAPDPAEPHMPRGHGRLSDGRSAASKEVTVTVAPEGLHLGGVHGGDLVWRYPSLTVGNPLRPTDVDAVLSLGDRAGVSLYIKDAALLRELAARAPHLTQTAFRRAGLRAAAPVGIAAASIAALVAVFDLSPSKAVARLIPEAARVRLGDTVLETLPVQKTCTEAAGRAALEALVVRLRPELKGKPHQVQVLDWNLINAFAVPGGRVVLTRAIINQASSAEEIAGVLAHEMGHGMELHPEAGLARGIGLWAMLQMMFTGTPGVAGNLGSVLLQLAYSRGYEREADAIALKMLRDAEIASKPFAGFFRRMEQRRGGDSDPRGSRSRTSDIFQTHPNSPERIQRIESQPPYPSRPALDPAQWQALKRICGGGPVGGAIDTANTDIKPKTTTPGAGMAEADKRVEANPRSAEAFAARAQLHMRDRRFAEAVADYGKAIEREPASAFFRYERGRAYQNASNFEAALADYAEAIRLNPRYSNAFAARGAVHRLQSRPREARSDFDEAIRINSRNDYALYQRGLINAAEQRWAESEADFARVLAGQKSYALAHVRRAEALERLTRREEAITAYRDALASSPSSPDAAIAFDIARERLRALGQTP